MGKEAWTYVLFDSLCCFCLFLTGFFVVFQVENLDADHVSSASFISTKIISKAGDDSVLTSKLFFMISLWKFQSYSEHQF